MAASGTAKVCVVCGQDVATKPRTKDNKGRYYCQPCYQRASAQRQATSTSAPRLVVPDEPESAPLNLLDDLIETVPVAVASTPCPQCGFAMPQGSSVCTHCGFNAQTGRVMKAKVIKAPTQSTNPGAIWAPIVGIISIVLGAGGVLMYGFMLVMSLLAAFQPGAFLPSLVSTLPISCLFTSLSAWLLRDGVRILRKDADGVKWIRFWAMAKFLIFGTCLTLIMAVPGRQMDQDLGRGETGGLPITANDIKSAFLLVMSWFLAWPVFCLVFFFIPRIQNDVERWD